MSTAEAAALTWLRAAIPAAAAADG